MTTFTIKDRKLVELQVKAFQSDDSHLCNQSPNELNKAPLRTQPIVQYRIEDGSEDLDDWPA
jgi:hypothetical protein